MARDWLKTLRTENFPSQSALAVAAGIKVTRYSRIESGYCDLRDDEAQALAKVFSKPLEFIKNGGSDAAKVTAKVNLTANGSAKPLLPKPFVAVTYEAAVIEIPSIVLPVTPKGLAVAKVIAAPAPASANDDLSDPAHFTLMPSTEALVQGPLDDFTFRAQLQKQAAFAAKVLHTSKVKPGVWVAWRDFEREAQNRLRGANVKPAPIHENVAPAPAAKPVPPAPREKIPVAVEKSRPAALRQNKNLFGHFVDVSKESLPVEKNAHLTELAADAKKQRPEIGFMKHFKRIAEEQLSKDDFQRIAAEANRRNGTEESFV